MRARSSLVPLVLVAAVVSSAGCGSGPAPTDTGVTADAGIVPGSDGGAGLDAAADATASDTGVGDTGAGDTGAVDTGAGDTGAVDTGVVDTGVGDTGAVDGATLDAGTSDAGPPPRTPCSADTDCAPGLCVTGLCFASSTTSESATGLGSISRLAAAADADGTLRLLTGVLVRDSSGFVTYPTYDAVGSPGAFDVTPGQVSSDQLGFDETGRAGTPVAHTSFVSSDERYVFVDQGATVNEFRPIYGFDAVHAADGTVYVLTTPRVPAGPSDLSDPYPLHLWTRTGTTWTSEELVHDTGTDRDLHLRVETGTGDPTVLYTDTFWIKRWRLETAGWASSIVYTFAPAPTRSGTSLWIDDPAGHTHLVRLLYGSTTHSLAYVELDDAGLVRDTTFPVSDVVAFAGSLSFDGAGNLWFLTVGDYTSPSRRPYTLHRIAADGSESSTLLGTIRTDFMQALALAAAPDGTLTVFVYSPTQPMDVRTLAPR